MEDAANKDEAERCRDLAKGFLSQGLYAKAQTFFDKSLRLYPLPGVAALRDKAILLDKHGPSGAAHAAGSSTKPGGGSSQQRGYTDEHERGAKKILAAAKKSHYEVLGISRRASGAELKKAYKKCALKFHPDKNSAPSAEGAFKAVSTAFETLNDPVKRESYDEYGHDRANEMDNRGSSNDPFGGADGGISPEELFGMLFSQGSRGFRTKAGGRGFHMHFNGMPGSQFRQQEAYSQDRESNLLQKMSNFLPILIVLFLTLSGFGSEGSTAKAFSLYRKGEYTSLRTTGAISGAGYDISPDIPYYVNGQFASKYAGNKNGVVQIERQVQQEFVDRLVSQCDKEQEHMNKDVYKLKKEEDIMARKSKSMPSCEDLEARFPKLAKQTYRKNTGKSYF